MKHSDLFTQIEAIIPTLGGWSIPEKVCEFAAIIIASRPKVTVEIGVWCGRGTIGMALAHRFVGCGKVHAIDPWNAIASVEGQDDQNAAWWSKQKDHDNAYEEFSRNLAALELNDWVDVQRATSELAVAPQGIGFLALDGNHGPQAVKDVERWAPMVNIGGIVYLDDMNWSGGAVAAAGDRLMSMGFVPLYQRDQGMFYKRSRELAPAVL